MNAFLRSTILIFCMHVFFCMQAIAQDSITEPQSISIAGIKAKEIAIDLTNPKEVELTLKKIHTYSSVEMLVLQGETDEVTWKRIISRLSFLKNLSKLNFKDNELSNMPENISSLKVLRSLTIEGNKDLDYNDLCKKVKTLPLTELNLIDNDIRKIPAAIAEISSLRKLQLTGSDRLNYEELMEQLAKLPALTTLAIPVNFITEVPKNISLLKSLQVLDVSNNVLMELPGEISSLKAINNLSIQGNLVLNPLKELEKLKGNDIRYLSLDKELSGDEIAQLKKMFPRVEINFPISEEEKSDSSKTEIEQTPAPEKIIYNGELKVKKDLAILSGAYLAYPALFRNLVYNFDTLTFEERYVDLRYTNTYERFQNGVRWSRGYYLNNRKHLLDQLDQLDGKRKETWFRLPNSPAFPELRAFSGMYWIYSGELSKRKFKRKFLKRSPLIASPVEWYDIRVVYDKNNSLFTIELKGQKGFEKFLAYPVQPTVSLENNQKNYNRRYLIYQKALLRRAQNFNRDQRKSRRGYDANFRRLNTYAWNELQLRMSNEEKLMSEQEWMDYYDNIVENEKKAIDNSSLSSGYLLRALSLCEYNTLSTLSTAAEQTAAPSFYGRRNINVDFINEEGLGKLPVATVWVVDNPSKYFYSFTGSLGITPSIISILPHASYSIIVQMRNGDFGTVNIEDTNKVSFEPNKVIPMNVKVLDKNLNTIGELLKAAGIH
jgi:hypothetical protein